MTVENLAAIIKTIVPYHIYVGDLSPYAVQSIETGRSNYPVQNLLTYLQDMKLRLVMKDMATEDCFEPVTVLDVHKVIRLLMDRYNIDNKLVYRKTGIHYTAPKNIRVDAKECSCKGEDDVKYMTSLSIKTLLAVCEVIHCDLLILSD